VAWGGAREGTAPRSHSPACGRDANAPIHHDRAERDELTHINGYIKVDEAEGVELVPLVNASKTAGTFQSWLTPECFAKYADEIA